MERCCGTCKWHWYENIDEGFVCTNIDSEYCADWTDYAIPAEDWEGKDDEKYSYLYKRVLELDELYTKITIITGFTAEQLLDLFERGFVLIGQDDIKENEALRKNEEVMRQNWYKASKTVQQQREELDRREKTIKELEKGVEELCSKNSMLEKMQPLQMDGEAARSLILAMELAEAKAELEQVKRERDAALSEICSRCERDYLQEKGTMFCSECAWNRRMNDD